MRYDKFTIKAQEALGEAESVVHDYNHSVLDVEHLLFALISQEDGVVPPLLDRLGVDKAILSQEIEEALKKKPRMYGTSAQISMSGECARVLNDAEKEASKLKDEYVSTEHLFLAMLDGDTEAARILARHGIMRDDVLKALQAIRGNQR
ncbi:MAG TPA: Clp protease N-terminal domain-containing protein, partial [Spirochaetia bacterium]|nr:Clp protease N-terminal domain-containing protein [Spirochaetia bacterium]